MKEAFQQIKWNNGDLKDVSDDIVGRVAAHKKPVAIDEVIEFKSDIVKKAFEDFLNLEQPFI